MLASHHPTIEGGVESIARMPPSEVRVSIGDQTIANSARLQEGFDSVTLSWDPPFDGVTGYWFRLSTAADGPVTPANGTFTTETSVTLESGWFTDAGRWYFDIVPVYGPGATVGAVANQAVIDVIDGGAGIASMSHPLEETWYPGKTIVATWTPPTGMAPEDVGRYHYRLDRNSQASYDSAAGWTATTTASAMFTKDASGQPITDFAYYVHVATEDRFGNIGAVAHRRVLIGAAPAQVSFYGYVKDAAGQALVGAELRLEPFGLVQTTQVAGYFLIDSVYAGPYTAFVTWPGGTFTLPVVVSAAASPMTVRPAP